MNLNLKMTLHDTAHRFGYDIVRFSPHYFYRARRSQVIKHCGVDVVLDVGANRGQYAAEIRKDGFAGRLVSFEPVAASFDDLSRSARQDQNWVAIRTAVGAHDGEITMKVSEDSVSSSILTVCNALTAVAPRARQTGVETVPITRLDTIADRVLKQSKTPLLKIDVQGYEKHVLEGLGSAIERIACIEVELSMRPLYEGEGEFIDILNWLADKGFDLISLGTGTVNAASGFVLQIDGIFLHRHIQSEMTMIPS